ncbi:YegP family protein [Dyadobacter sp. CY326]|uniref:YegP family protein n=1 Tax=Dyadobacter sp. CY326 TaxID=2907300 RepID=UPI001F2D4FDF|nr:YegP family protein [Dyadobacter sp. CY326]MCE7065168.1 YegP family protein [Dyadobacter sp. CY326]
MEKFTISESLAGQFRFALLSKTGKVILTSDGHHSRDSCLVEISKVRKFSQEHHRFDKQLLAKGKCYFNLEATNGYIIAVSPLFDCFLDMDAGIDCVKRYGQAVDIEDVTLNSANMPLVLQLA